MKILTIGHSYVVALNRRLCRALGQMEGVSVTVAAPAFLKGDLRPIALEMVDDEPYELVPIRFRESRFPQLSRWDGRALRALLNREPWDIVHAWVEPYVVAGFQIARGTPRGASLIFSTFQNLSKRYPPPFNAIESNNLWRSSGWTAFGQTVAETLGDRPVYRNLPTRMIPLGVDSDHFQPDPEAGRRLKESLGWSEDGPPIVGYLGRFVPEKGLDLLMKALDSRPSETWRALLVGGGPMEGALRSWGEGHGDRVRIVTGVPHDDVPRHLAAMDLLAAPSLTTPKWREQLGRMLLEAMAMGVAVVASDSGEIPHVVADAGLIVPEGNLIAWSNALGQLIEDRPARQALALRGLDRARTVYAWPVIARQFLDFFREVHGPPSVLSRKSLP